MVTFPGFSESQLQSMRARVLSDISAVLGARRELTLFDGRTGVGSRRDAESLAALADDDTESLFVQFGGHWFRSDEIEFGRALVQVASGVQDDVIDELGHGWPELVVYGQFAGILTPAVDQLGNAVWASRRGPHCLLGALEQIR